MDIIQIEKIKAYCLSKRGAYEDHPFGEIPVCFKLNGKIFAQLYPDMITLKCTVDAAEFYRNMISLSSRSAAVLEHSIYGGFPTGRACKYDRRSV